MPKPYMNATKLPAFVMLSGIGWCIDFAIFNYLIAMGLTYFQSNLVSAAAAVSFVLVTARRWIFLNHVESLTKVVIKYVLWNMAAVTAASLLVQLVATNLERGFLGNIAFVLGYIGFGFVSKVAIASNFSKLLVTPITMYANFIAVGYIVERRVSFY